MAGSVKKNHLNFQNRSLSQHVQPRFLWADVIRILAIFLVLATHLSYQPDSVTTGGLVYFLYFAVVKTCIPLFVMLSGALLLGKSEPYVTFFKKRMSRLMLPWVFWSLIFFLFQKEFLLVHDVPSFFKTFIGTMESFWFLPMIACLYVLTPVIRVFVQNAKLKEVAYIIIIWFLVISFFPYHHNSMAFPRQVDNGLLRQVVNFLGYFLLGYFILQLRDKISPVFSMMIFLLGLSWTLTMTLAAQLPSQLLMYLYDYIAPGNILMSVGIFAFVMSAFGKAESHISRAHRTLRAISSASLGIYFIHAFVWPLLQRNLHFKIYPFPNGIISAVVLFTVCFAIIFTLQKIPVVKRFIS